MQQNYVIIYLTRLWLNPIDAKVQKPDTNISPTTRPMTIFA